MEEFIASLKHTLPCRENQLSQIIEFIGEKDEPVPHCLYLYGNTATGKTACVTTVLKHYNLHHVILNAVECYSQKVLYETILNSLAGHKYDSEKKFASLYKCDNMKDFVGHLNNVYKKYKYEPVIIVIDKAERLRNMDHNILPVFLRLKEFCTLNVCTILISDVIFEKYYLKTGLWEPIKIFFPQYSKEELYKIISLDQSKFANFVLRKYQINMETQEDVLRKDVFANYLNAFLSVFYKPCRDLVELKQMAMTNYATYCEPIIDGSMKADDVTKLWRNIAPSLKTSLEMLYLRINPSKNFNHAAKDDPNSRDMEMRMERLGITKDEMASLRNDGESKLTDELMSTKTFAQNFELPFYAKFLLIAAYLASFNPAKEDKRLFMKTHGKQKKRMQQVKAKAVVSEKLNTQLGPKPFTLDRLLAIFYAILDERVGLTANLLVQISSLVSLRLLTASTDSTKYKCTVGYDFIVAISKMVGFNIRKYLYDFI